LVPKISATFLSFSSDPDVVPFSGNSCLKASTLAEWTNVIWKDALPLLLLLKTT